MLSTITVTFFNLSFGEISQFEKNREAIYKRISNNKTKILLTSPHKSANLAKF